MARRKTAADEAYNERRRQARASARAQGKRLASDEAYNARRRLQREASRLQKQAQAASGAYAERLSSLASELRGMASNLYQQKSGEYRSDLMRESRNVRSMSEERQTDILLSSNIGSRIYAGTKEIWIDKDANEREDAIIKAFGVRSMLDVLKILERQLGSLLYADDTPENYDIVALSIMVMVA